MQSSWLHEYSTMLFLFFEILKPKSFKSNLLSDEQFSAQTFICAFDNDVSSLVLISIVNIA